ncbi:MAG: hypothetical protein Q7S22_00805 [Candidatus Micrarchaeota archaeon]|nr:hypothetical protein [Candidatus Micrarchaeota archaeon]
MLTVQTSKGRNHVLGMDVKGQRSTYSVSKTAADAVKKYFLLDLSPATRNMIGLAALVVTLAVTAGSAIRAAGVDSFTKRVSVDKTCYTLSTGGYTAYVKDKLGKEIVAVTVPINARYVPLTLNGKTYSVTLSSDNGLNAAILGIFPPTGFVRPVTAFISPCNP